MDTLDVNWSQQPKTLILALQSKCRFCNESASFYKRIVEIAQKNNVKLVAVFPSAIEESVIHLKSLGLSNMEVKQSSLKNLQVSGTPTLILTDEKGKITHFWIGRLSSDKEKEVIEQLNL